MLMLFCLNFSVSFCYLRINSPFCYTCSLSRSSYLILHLLKLLLSITSSLLFCLLDRILFFDLLKEYNFPYTLIWGINSWFFVWSWWLCCHERRLKFLKKRSFCKCMMVLHFPTSFYFLIKIFAIKTVF